MSLTSRIRWQGVLMLSLLVLMDVTGQAPANTPETVATLGLEQGLLLAETPDFRIKLVTASQTLAALEPVGENVFDFTPADRLSIRSRDGFYHLGDIKFR